MGPQINSVVSKCRGLLGMLRRASSHLPTKLLKLIYTAVIRSQLEYCSSTFINAAPTHLTKLDVIQKIAARIITGVPSQSHSAPLLLQLDLESLHVRRLDHYATLVENVIKGNSHPYFRDFFQPTLASSTSSRSDTKLNNKRFSRFGSSLRKDNNNSNDVLTHPLDRSLLGHAINSRSTYCNPSAMSTTFSHPLALQPPPPVSGSMEDCHR